jgi:hypothetical protein
LFYKTPSKVYVSVAQFMQPEKVFGKRIKKSEWVIDNTFFLKSDLLFDLDSEYDLSTALQDAQTIYRFMKTELYELINIKFSGNKGFQLLYKDKEPIKEPHPIKRLQLTQKKRQELVRRLPKLKTIDKIHKNIIADQFRVCAVIGSIKAKTGYKVSLIPEHIFINLKSFQTIRVARPIRSMTNTPSHKLGTTPISGKERPTLSSQGQFVAGSPSPNPAFPYSYRFISNRIKGTDRYIMVLKYPLNKRINIDKIQQKYNLSEFYRFEYSKIQMFVNFKALSKERIIKIMRCARPQNLNAFLHFKHDWIPISDAIGNNGNIVWKLPELKEIIESPYGLNDQHSRPHARLLNLQYSSMVGKYQNTVYKAIVKDEKQ